MNPDVAEGTMMTADEFARLQDELMALKMENHDLEENNRRLRRQPGDTNSAGQTAGPHVATPASNAAAHGKPMRNKMLTTDFGSSLKSAFVAQQAPVSDDTPADEEDDDSVEQMREQVNALGQRLEAAVAELESARLKASNRCAGVKAPIAKPSEIPAKESFVSVGDLRQRLDGRDCNVSDVILKHVLGAVSATMQSKGSAIGGDIHSSTVTQSTAQVAQATRPGDSAQEEQDPLALLREIQRQQRDLEKLRDSTEKQRSHISQLSMQLDATLAEDVGQGEGRSKKLEDRLRDTERQLGQLEQRKEISEQISPLTYELSCHMREVADRLRKRQHAMELCLVDQANGAALCTLLREELAMSREDLRSAHSEEAYWRGEIGGASAEEALPLDVNVQVAPAIVEVEVSVPALPLVETSEAVAQTTEADLPPEAADKQGERERLQEQLAQLRKVRQDFQLRSAKEAQELRNTLRDVRPNSGFEQASTERVESPKDALSQPVKQEEAEPARLVEPASSGLLYVQKIAELEELSAGLERDLELIRESEQVLVQDRAEKDDIISYLMRRVRCVESGSGAAATEQPGAGGAWGFLAGAWGALGNKSQDREGDVEELERIAEEMLLDNIRLKNDLRTITQEFRKTVTGSRHA